MAGTRTRNHFAVSGRYARRLAKRPAFQRLCRFGCFGSRRSALPAAAAQRAFHPAFQARDRKRRASAQTRVGRLNSARPSSPGACFKPPAAPSTGL